MVWDGAEAAHITPRTESPTADWLRRARHPPHAAHGTLSQHLEAKAVGGRADRHARQQHARREASRREAAWPREGEGAHAHDAETGERECPTREKERRLDLRWVTARARLAARAWRTLNGTLRCTGKVVMGVKVSVGMLHQGLMGDDALGMMHQGMLPWRCCTRACFGERWEERQV